MVDIDAAIGFVVARGDALDRARLSHLRTGAPPAEEILDQLERGQTPAGGWPVKPHDPVASVDATCFRLAELDDLSALGRPVAQRALRWLVSCQRPDGCWEEDASLAGSAPPWAAPGDRDARFYLTASAAFWLAIAAGDAQVADPGVPSPYEPSLQRAAAALRAQVDESGAWPGFLSSGWLAAGALHRNGDFYEAARMFVTLRDRVPTMSAGDAAALIVAAIRAGLGPDDALVVAAQQRLAATQRHDGAWTSGDDESFNVETTLTALRALRVSEGWAGDRTGEWKFIK